MQDGTSQHAPAHVDQGEAGCKITPQSPPRIHIYTQTNVQRLEDDALEKAHAFRVAERDRQLIKEARERRLKEKTDRARKAAQVCRSGARAGAGAGVRLRMLEWWWWGGM